MLTDMDGDPTRIYVCCEAHLCENSQCTHARPHRGCTVRPGWCGVAGETVWCKEIDPDVDWREQLRLAGQANEGGGHEH